VRRGENRPGQLAQISWQPELGSRAGRRFALPLLTVMNEGEIGATPVRVAPDPLISLRVLAGARVVEVAVRGVHFAELVRRRGVESFTGPEEVSMHPMMIMAVAREAERERARERNQVKLRALAVANRAGGFTRSHGASGFARRLFVGISLRPQVS
jgi:hypothetical protein